MPKDILQEREFELVNILGAELGVNQRDISKHLELSLGTTNMLIRRLIAKGYIRIKQLNQRKVEYILTPKGFAEKMRKSVKYTLKTINSISLIKEQIKVVGAQLYYEEGERQFVIVGKSDFAMLIDMTFQEMGLKDYRISHVTELPPEKEPGVILICREQVTIPINYRRRVIDLIHELAQDQRLVPTSSGSGG